MIYLYSESVRHLDQIIYGPRDKINNQEIVPIKTEMKSVPEKQRVPVVATGAENQNVQHVNKLGG
jgi:hypothetical protein